MTYCDSCGRRTHRGRTACAQCSGRTNVRRCVQCVDRWVQRPGGLCQSCWSAAAHRSAPWQYRAPRHVPVVPAEQFAPRSSKYITVGHEVWEVTWDGT